MKKPSDHLAALAARQPPDDDDHTLVLRCQDCGVASASVEWVDFNSRCPDCSSTRAELWTPKAKPRPPAALRSAVITLQKRRPSFQSSRGVHSEYVPMSVSNLRRRQRGERETNLCSIPGLCLLKRAYEM